uniref:protein-tyrosine-phosphatase n=1 Tax=Magallana gigas TaxID=29159 RepID=K1QTY8_MAGGI
MLPYGEQHPCEVGKRQENLAKNRFKTTFPYDHSRVILTEPDKPSNDYINANYISGLDEEKVYIASQGPKQTTLNDFWTMIWQEKVTQIVMLTNLKEGVKVKCIQYWPENTKSRLHGNIVIKNVEEKQYAFYVIRKLAGIGRTGTYIALDALYKAGKASGKINVAECVKIMRANRMNMVQTYEQYKTILLALNEKFKVSLEAQSLADFTKKIDSMRGDHPANQTGIRKEFESYQKDRAFIVTQYPTPEDAVDFLRLLNDHDSDTVICMNPLYEIESSKTWFPEKASSKDVAPFVVQHESESDTEVKVTTVNIIHGEVIGTAD